MAVALVSFLVSAPPARSVSRAAVMRAQIFDDGLIGELHYTKSVLRGARLVQCAGARRKGRTGYCGIE